MKTEFGYTVITGVKYAFNTFSLRCNYDTLSRYRTGEGIMVIFFQDQMIIRCTEPILLFTLF